MELLSSGVFITELEPRTQVIPSVATSTLAVVSFTPEGKVDEPIVCTSLPEYFDKFGTFTRKSYGAFIVSAAFANGLSRLVQIRVVPSDAVLAKALIEDVYTGEIAGGVASAAQVVASNGAPYNLNNGQTVTVSVDGGGAQTATFSATQASRTGVGVSFNVTITLGVNDTLTLTFDDAVAQTVTLTAGSRSLANIIDEINAAVIRGRALNSGGQLQIRCDISGTASSVTIAGNAASTVGGGAFAGTTAGTGNVANIDAVTAAEVNTILDAAFNADVTHSLVLGKPAVTRAVVGSTKTIQMGGTAATTIGFSTSLTAGTDGSASSVSRSGAIDNANVTYTGTISNAPVKAGSVTITYTDGTAKTITDNGAGVLQGAATGTIDYTTGAYAFVATGAPDTSTNILFTYTHSIGEQQCISKGDWGNKLKAELRGNENFFNLSTGTWDKYDYIVSKKDDAGVYQVKETHEELSITDSSDAGYLPDVVNADSDLVRLVTPWSNDVPKDFKSTQKTSEAQPTITGNGSTKQFSGTLVSGAAPGIVKKSLTITAKKADDSVMTITDDGLGKLTGDVDATGTNTIDYSTGAYNVTFVAAVKNGDIALATYKKYPAATSKTYAFASGSDGVAAISRAEVSAIALKASRRGLYALETIDEMMTVIIPDFTSDTTVIGDMLDYAELRKDLFVLFNPPKGSDAQQAVDWFRIKMQRYSDFAACYWPWIRVADPLGRDRPYTIPPLGHVAGVYARTDRDKNVGKAPAGTVDGSLRGLVGLERKVTQGDRDLVYPAWINPFREDTQVGKAVWGARTISNRSAWRYVNVRRLFTFVEKSFYNATHWTVFENNGPGLWVRVKLQADSFLNARFQDGYFAGRTPAEAFLVVCDETNNSQDSNRLNVGIALAANKPNEFSVYAFSQRTAA